MDLNLFADESLGMEGALRRRFLGGAIIGLFIGPLLQEAYLQKLLDLVKEPTTAIITLLVIYGMGVVVELAGEMLLARSAAGAMWALELPIEIVTAQTFGAKWALRGLLYYFVIPILAYALLILGFFGYCPYRESLRSLRTQEAHKAFGELPNAYRIGFEEPYGSYFETAWRGVAKNLCEDDKRLIYQMMAKNKDVLVITTSIAAGLGVSLGVKMLGYDSAYLAGLLPALPVLMLLPLVLIYWYVISLRTTLYNSLEIYALARPLSNQGTECKEDMGKSRA